MPSFDFVLDGADAVRRFAQDPGSRRADRIQVRIDAADGMDRLCAVEAVLCDLWPPATAKELVWLTRRGADEGDKLHLQAFAADGEVLCRASFRLAGGRVRTRDDGGSGRG
jgi:hypothetical protein